MLVYGMGGRHAKMRKADICTQITHKPTVSKREGKCVTRDIALSSMKATTVPLLLFFTIIFPEAKSLSG